jgi:hypothetical protein
MSARAGSWALISLTSSMKQGESKLGTALILKPTPSDILPPSKPTPLSLSKPPQQLETKDSNIWAYGRHFLTNHCSNTVLNFFRLNIWIERFSAVYAQILIYEKIWSKYPHLLIFRWPNKSQSMFLTVGCTLCKLPGWHLYLGKRLCNP